MNKIFASVAALIVLASAGSAAAQTYQYGAYGAYNNYYQPQYAQTYPSLNCVVLTRDLKYGSRGTDVRSLQSFLVGLNFPGSGAWMLTGFYGRATEAAVRTYQSSRNLYPSGIVDTNTRGAILQSCGGQYSNPSYPAYPTQPSYPAYPGYPTNPCTSYPYSYGGQCQNSNVSISYLSPSQGGAGTSVTITGTGFSYSGNTVRFGNTTIPSVSSFNGTSLTFTVPSTMQTNTGMYYGNTMTAGAHSVSVTNASGMTSNQLTFNLTGGSQNAPTISSVNGPTSLSTGNTGTFTVVVNNPQYNSYLTTSVNWGDTNYGYANASAPQTTYTQGASTLTFSHAYQYAGTYIVTFTVSNGNGQQNTATATVTVSGSTNTGSITMTANPNAGNAPLYTTFSVYFPGCSGGNYYLYFGDGSSEFVAVPADLCNATRTITHTYTTGGTYTAQLRNNNQSSTITSTMVTVNGGSSTGTLSASPTYGTKPLNVVFTGNPGGASYNGGVVIVFGDGSAGTFCTQNESCTQRTISHIYSTAGTYYVTVQGSNNGTTSNLGTATITVIN